MLEMTWFYVCMVRLRMLESGFEMPSYLMKQLLWQFNVLIAIVL